MEIAPMNAELVFLLGLASLVLLVLWLLPMVRHAYRERGSLSPLAVFVTWTLYSVHAGLTGWMALKAPLGRIPVPEWAAFGAGAVLAPGVILTGAVPLYDLVRKALREPLRGQSTVVPDGAVVVPGTRPASGEFARRHGVHLQCPVIVKYRDPSTNASLSLEDVLR